MNGIKKKTAEKEAGAQNIITQINCLNLTKNQRRFLLSVIDKVNKEESNQESYSRQCVAELKDDAQKMIIYTR